MGKLTVGEVDSLADAKAFVDQHANHLKSVDVHMILLGLSKSDREVLARYIRERGIEQVGESGE